MTHRFEYVNLGKNIAYLRKKSRLTQEGLALKANISRGYLSQIEAENVEKSPSLDIIFNIANVLGHPVYQLFLPNQLLIAKMEENKK